MQAKKKKKPPQKIVLAPQFWAVPKTNQPCQILPKLLIWGWKEGWLFLSHYIWGLFVIQPVREETHTKKIPNAQLEMSSLDPIGEARPRVPGW